MPRRGDRPGRPDPDPDIPDDDTRDDDIPGRSDGGRAAPGRHHGADRTVPRNADPAETASTTDAPPQQPMGAGEGASGVRPAGAASGVSRRAVFAVTGAGVAVGAANGALAEAAIARSRGRRSAPLDAGQQARLAASDLAPTAGDLPLGLADPVPAFAQMMAFDLTPAVRASTRSARTAAIGFLTAVSQLARDGVTASDPTGQAAAGLDLRPSNLQITPGMGASLLAATGLTGKRPRGLLDLPRFASDHLDPARCGGDLVVQVAAEDPMRLSGAVQQVLATASAHGVALRWARSGFRSTTAASENPTVTTRNVMGHKDGTANPELGSALWNYTVRVREPGWMQNGSYMVVRTIAIELHDWFAMSEAARDAVIGRRTSNGAPLTGTEETDQSDLAQKDAAGRYVIPATAHLRLANAASTGGARIFRRPWNYDDGFDQHGRRVAGQLFVAWQNDLARGFIPIQQSLERGNDALFRHIRHIGSAVFAVPAQGTDAYVGQRLLEG